ncbi:Uncharacterised protein [Mycobacteroides abscessus subsp. abscessus]|nr:Uncharacterised protein [Mycobacteroides abscessus subsp. abscessus]
MAIAIEFRAVAGLSAVKGCGARRSCGRAVGICLRKGSEGDADRRAADERGDGEKQNLDPQLSLRMCNVILIFTGCRGVPETDWPNIPLRQVVPDW